MLAALVLLRPGALPVLLKPILAAFPYAVFGTGLALAWYFHRCRIAFALVVLAAADLALVHYASGRLAASGSGQIVAQAVSLLLPLNLGGYLFVRERGLFSRKALVQWLLLALQAIGIWLLCRPGMADLVVWLHRPILPLNTAVLTPLSQPALLAFGVALGVQAMRFLLTRNPVDGGFIWATVAGLVALHGRPVGWMSTQILAAGGLTLITGLLQASYRMAFHDELTGLPGRRAMTDALQGLGGHYAIAMMDVDHFKKFNDTYGHDVGDQVLRMVASRIGAVTGGGRAYRYGGEEFCVLFPGGSVEDARPHLEAVRQAVEASRFTVRGRGRPRKRPAHPRSAKGARRQVTITISVGVAERDGRNSTPDSVVKAADKALYRSKEDGRNRIST